MPRCYQLVGVPGAGKSTWIKDQIWALGMFVVSTDNLVEAYASQQGKTYNEVFDEYMPTAVKLMADQVVFCRNNNLDLIWDQTSTTVASRAKKFRMLPNYEHIAVVFDTHRDVEELDRRLRSRPNKVIPSDVLMQMINNFELPTLDEGFAEIWHAQN
jgi:predicted kinase